MHRRGSCSASRYYDSGDLVFERRDPKPKAREHANRQNDTTATQNRIDEYRAMVDEEARRLAAERQKAEQARAQVQAAAAAAMQLQYPPLIHYAGSQNRHTNRRVRSATAFSGGGTTRRTRE